MTMIEQIARAMCAANGGHWDATNFNETLNGESPEEQREYWLDCAKAAVKAMRTEHTLEIQMFGAEAIALYNIETDGPAKAHDECKTPDDWMARGANIAGRMVSGQEASRCFNAMIDAILNEAAA